VIIVDAVLGTGKTANLAIKILKEQGVEEANISFVNIISCEEGITAVLHSNPKVRIISA
jgi:uracil phosphoribosyltransferase